VTNSPGAQHQPPQNLERLLVELELHAGLAQLAGLEVQLKNPEADTPLVDFACHRWTTRFYQC
jgi:hypothetical protein